MSCGVGCRRSSDPVLLWLWRRLAATAPNESLAWEHPYATGAALEKARRPKKKKKKEGDIKAKSCTGGKSEPGKEWCSRQREQYVQRQWLVHLSGPLHLKTLFAPFY